MGSPGAMSPVAFATPSTPHLNLGCSCFTIMARFNPFWKRSINAHGVRSPVSSTIAEFPIRRRVPSGNFVRSSPAVVTFSPRFPGAT